MMMIVPQQIILYRVANQLRTWYILINKRKYIKHVADVYTTTCSLHTYTNPSKKIFPAWGNISLEHVQIAMEQS